MPRTAYTPSLPGFSADDDLDTVIKGEKRLSGVTAFGVPVSETVLTNPLPYLRPARTGRAARRSGAGRGRGRPPTRCPRSSRLASMLVVPHRQLHSCSGHGDALQDDRGSSEPASTSSRHYL